MKHKDLISIVDLTPKEINQIFKLTKKLKKLHKKRKDHLLLLDKTLAMIFQKPSTRTRVSFEAGMYHLGGYALFLSAQDLQLRRGETIKDTAMTLSRYVDGIMIRTYDHQDVEDLAKYGTIPVINGLSDLLHPCQVLSDLYTIKEKKGRLKKLKVAYVGDGNNVANSWCYGAAKTGMELSLACPSRHQPNEEVVKRASGEAMISGAKINILENPSEAVKDADVIYTDVWSSMGKEGEEAERRSIFYPYQVNEELVSKAKKDVIVMHCLPAHRGEEITDGVMDGPHSVVFDQAENRLHVQKAILVLLLGK
ncbi:ornithine carbamoyltransferase [bacterium]|nr:ornithine carbamoyltransferase [bacterium]MBU4561022.1 ornithine carbamoyltransferase [bacterium]MCG2675993.1 ornithine carbamoyltransferase [bacterium]MCG2677520.1 ornithine carbamoyltransferase [bacterium]